MRGDLTHGLKHPPSTKRTGLDALLPRMAAGLIKGEGFAVDAGLIAAHACYQHSVQAGETCDLGHSEIDTRPMREYLAALDGDAIAGSPAQDLAE